MFTKNNVLMILFLCSVNSYVCMERVLTDDQNKITRNVLTQFGYFCLDKNVNFNTDGEWQDLYPLASKKYIESFKANHYSDIMNAFSNKEILSSLMKYKPNIFTLHNIEITCTCLAQYIEKVTVEIIDADNNVIDEIAKLKIANRLHGISYNHRLKEYENSIVNYKRALVLYV